MNKAFLVAQRNAATVSITTAYSELVASTAQETLRMCTCSSASGIIIFGFGGAGAEVDQFAVRVSTTVNDSFFCSIPKGTRVSIKSDTTISSGVFNFTFFTK